MIDTTKMMINKAQQLTTRIHKLEQTDNEFTIDDYWNMDLYKSPRQRIPWLYRSQKPHYLHTRNNRDSNTEHPTAHHSSSLTTALNRSQRLQHWRSHCLPSRDEDQMTESLLWRQTREEIQGNQHHITSFSVRQMFDMDRIPVASNQPGSSSEYKIYSLHKNPKRTWTT